MRGELKSEKKLKTLREEGDKRLAGTTGKKREKIKRKKKKTTKTSSKSYLKSCGKGNPTLIFVVLCFMRQNEKETPNEVT